jgi:hypothetical protein
MQRDYFIFSQIFSGSHFVLLSDYHHTVHLQRNSFMVKRDYGDRNIFNITQPERYRCQIAHYHKRLSRLYLSVYKEQQTTPAFYLLFSDTAYFECPVNWQGADFGVASEDACIQLMLEVGLIGQAILQFPGAYASITEHARLYEVATNKRPIRFIANSATMLRQLPADVREN